jgi:hypothetical protein
MKQVIVTGDELDNIDFIPTIIMGFYQSTQDDVFSLYYQKLKVRFPDVDIIGCSSESNIYNDLPYVDENDKNSSVFICLDIKKDAYSVQISTIESMLKKKEKKVEGYGAILFCSRYFTFLENIIFQLQKKRGYRPLFGAIAGTTKNEDTKGTVFFNGNFYEEHLLLWEIDQKCYCLEGRSVYHFQPVGFDMEVTHAEETILYEIENRPALRVLEEIIGDLRGEMIDFFDYPFFLKENRMMSFSDAPLCSIKSVDKDIGSIHLYRSVKKYTKLKMGISLGREEEEKELQVFNEFKNRKNAVAFLFNCVGIKANLGLMEFVYLMELKKALHIPFIGFHSFGEIGSVNPENISILHNQTISIAVLSEREGKECS